CLLHHDQCSPTFGAKGQRADRFRSEVHRCREHTTRPEPARQTRWSGRPISGSTPNRELHPGTPHGPEYSKGQDEVAPASSSDQPRVGTKGSPPPCYWIWERPRICPNDRDVLPSDLKRPAREHSRGPPRGAETLLLVHRRVACPVRNDNSGT